MALVVSLSANLSKEEQTDANDGDDGSKNSAPSDFLVEKPIRGQKDDNGRHCHQR